LRLGSLYVNLPNAGIIEICEGMPAGTDDALHPFRMYSIWITGAVNLALLLAGPPEEPVAIPIPSPPTDALAFTAVRPQVAMAIKGVAVDPAWPETNVAACSGDEVTIRVPSLPGQSWAVRRSSAAFARHKRERTNDSVSFTFKRSKRADMKPDARVEFADTSAPARARFAVRFQLRCPSY
jgi:hypothetical protein